jgi:hypothetical protein
MLVRSAISGASPTFAHIYPLSLSAHVAYQADDLGVILAPGHCSHVRPELQVFGVLVRGSASC